MDDYLSDNQLLESQELRDLVLAVLDDAKAQDPQVIDLTDRSSFADYMVIATGGSSRQVKAMADRLVQRSKAHNIRPLGVEGADEGEWVLVDLDDVVVHLMQPQTRAFYNLEKLWTVPQASQSSVRA